MLRWFGKNVVPSPKSGRTQLQLHDLEDRVVLTSDVLPEDYYAVGAEAGDAPVVTVYDAVTNEEAHTFEA